MRNHETASAKPVYRDVIRARLRDIPLRYDPDKPDGIPAELNDLWEEIADELDRVADWLSDAGSIGGLILSRGATRAAESYTYSCYKRWWKAVDAYIKDLPEHCPDCARTHAALDAAGIDYEVLSA